MLPVKTFPLALTNGFLLEPFECSQPKNAGDRSIVVEDPGLAATAGGATAGTQGAEKQSTPGASQQGWFVCFLRGRIDGVAGGLQKGLGNGRGVFMVATVAWCRKSSI